MSVRALCLLLAGYTAAASSNAMQIQTYTLGNGMHIVVAVRPELLLASVNLTVDIGALDDPIGKSGIAHMLEHTTLSGARDVGSLDCKAESVALAELDRAHRALNEQKRTSDPDASVRADLEQWVFRAQRGAQATAEDREVIGSRLESHGAIGLNATTSADVTQFFATLPPGEVDLWLSLEAARLQRPIFRRYYLERNVVSREIGELTAGKPTCQEQLLRDLYPRSPLQQSLAGNPDELSEIDRPEALAYFRRFYVPQRITVTVVGNLQPEAIRAICEKYFGRWHPDEEAAQPRTRTETVTPIDGLKVHICNKTRRPIALFAYPEQSANPEQAIIFDVLAELINSEDFSPLVFLLEQKNQIAAAVHATAEYPSQKLPALFVVSIRGAAGVAHEHLVDATLEALKKMNELSDQDIRGGIYAAEMKLAERLEDPQALASILGADQANHNNATAALKRLEALRSLSVANVRAVARRLFALNPHYGDAQSTTSIGAQKR
jgi:predicted Zn-dependent peptidase